MVLYVLRVHSVRPHERVVAWDPHVPGVREVFHARFVEHAYPPHAHQAWTVLIVDAGAIRYALDRRSRGSDAAHVTVLPPHVTHDGRAAGSGGFAKRVVYLDEDVVGAHLIGRAVDQPAVGDERLVRQVRALHDALRHPVDALEAETRVAFVAEHVTAQLAGAPPGPARGDAVDDGGGGERGAHVAGALRDLLDADPVTSRTLRSLAAEIDVSPTHLVRCFTARFGVAPHAYLVGQRVGAARRMLLDGRAPAEVAVATGFHDQAHLTRHFRRHVGTTPGRYRRCAG